MENEVQETVDSPTEEMSQAELARAIRLQAAAEYRRTSFEAEKALKGMTMEHWFNKLNLQRFL